MNLTDISPFPFGKFEGTPMKDVPVEYLHWVWLNIKPWNEQQIAVKDYVERSKSALKKENADLIWSK